MTTPQSQIEEARKEISILLQLQNIRWYGNEKKALSLALRILERMDEGFITKRINDYCRELPLPEMFDYHIHSQEIAKYILTAMVKEEKNEV